MIGLGIKVLAKGAKAVNKYKKLKKAQDKRKGRTQKATQTTKQDYKVKPKVKPKPKTKDTVIGSGLLAAGAGGAAYAVKKDNERLAKRYKKKD